MIGAWPCGINDRSARLRLGVMGGRNLDLDQQQREVEVPAELAAALEQAGATAAFDPLTCTRRTEPARGVAEAKKPETRDRRIAVVVAELSG